MAVLYSMIGMQIRLIIIFPTDQGAAEASIGSAGKSKPTSDYHNNGQSTASAAACMSRSEVKVLEQENRAP